jgi:ubiquinone/menaquinone biosynthesis C-methylase UbiE
MKPVNCATGFGNVDQTADPQAFINYLDIVGSIDTIQAYKRQAYELLSVEPGHHILDVGCGLGDDVRQLAALVGPAGRVVGLDSSQAMVEVARQRSLGTNLPVEFHVGDAERLDITDAAFDRCRADRICQHLQEPQKAIAEMARVVRPGGKIVIAEPDYGTMAIDSDNRALSRRILDFYCDQVCQGWIGRQLPRLFKEAGLTDVTTRADTVILTNYTFAEKALGLQTVALRAQGAGAITLDEALEWLGYLRRASQAGRFFCSVTGFSACGSKHN